MTEPRWLAWGRELAAIAQNGRYFASGFDLERYADVRRIAAEILAEGGDADAERVEARLALDDGYATPKIDVRGVVARGSRVLLVREVSDGGWTLPGGWADPMDSPGRSAAREVGEEAGLSVDPVGLLGVFDRAGHPDLAPHPFRVWKLLVRCEPRDPSAVPRADGVETDDVGWFDPSDPPSLSLGRTLPGMLTAVAARLADPSLPPHLD
ncbi:NUDIX domain-containing protein [Egibacter rhizosphaerae]|uniref:NUDIX domain-containing protein n=1 Tax=Egibacter rhizosphaerae TaxID=1670831 RepID=A0A411YIM4_9ACTN|nr:NUDIX hydrolase N-terminal domain-containing protein [Egibacter rhizosphaerae]QBI21118.1 NUDIX domain-containing protein [Egibacter rhizosphaerae]